MSSRVTEACGCWSYHNDQDILTSAGYCEAHWKLRSITRRGPKCSTNTCDRPSCICHEPYSKAEILSYLRDQHAMYESLSRSTVPPSGETSKSFNRGAKVLADLIEEINLGALALHARLSREGKPHDPATLYKRLHENNESLPPANENPDALREKARNPR